MRDTHIVFADDSERYRRSVLAQLPDFHIRCLGEAANGKELLRLLIRVKPDVVLLDLQMPVMDGNQTLDLLLRRFPAIKVIVLSFHYDPLLVQDYLERGVFGYLPKDEVAGDIPLLARAVREVSAGCIFPWTPADTSAQASPQTQKQRKMISMMCQGFTNSEIAEVLQIRVRGVEKQRSKIYSRIQGGRAVDFYRHAFSKGLQFLKKITKPNRKLKS